jgi:hypothetical protein
VAGGGVSNPRAAAFREAMAMVTAADDERLMREMWEGHQESEWAVARELAALGAASLQVLAECQGRAEADVLAELGIRWGT